MAHLGPGVPRSNEGSSPPLDRLARFRRSIAAIRPGHPGSIEVEPDRIRFQNRSIPVGSPSNERDKGRPSGTSMHVGRSNGPPRSSGARKGWQTRQPGRRVLERKPCRFDWGFRPFLRRPSKPNRVDLQRKLLGGRFGSSQWSIANPPALGRVLSASHQERKRPRLGSVPNPERSSDRILAPQPSDRTRRETAKVLDGAMGSQAILQDTRGKTVTDGRFARTHSAIAVSRPASMEWTKRRLGMRNGRDERQLHDLCLSFILHVRTEPRFAANLPQTATQNKKCFRDRVGNLGRIDGWRRK